MPKIVNHADRRSLILDAAWRVILRSGIPGVSIRAVAAEAGLSMGATTYYFADKDDLVVSTYRRALQRTADRIERVVRSRTGLDALRDALLAALPLDEPRRQEAQIDLAFSAACLTNPALRRVRSESRAWEKSLCTNLLTGPPASTLPTLRTSPEQTAENAILFLDALSLTGALSPEIATVDYLTAAVDDFLRKL